MGKGDKDRPVNKKRYDKNFDSIKWGIETPNNENIMAHEVGIKKEKLICKICSIAITEHDLATFTEDGVCHSGCVFAPGER